MMRYILLLALAFTPSVAVEQGFEYQTVELRGWTVHFEQVLVEDKELYSEVESLLQAKLREIDSRLPPKVVIELRKVPIYFHLNRGDNPGACYHPSAQWLSEHDLPVKWARSVEFGVAKNFLTWIHDQPSMVLHEMSHAYHHRVLGYKHAGVLAAYANAMEKELYKEVAYVRGGVVPGYASTNEMEYFAETSEAYWGTNDQFPFVRGELMSHDAEMVKVLGEAWVK
jgi:dipeptidyl-peptidase-4